MDKRSGKALAAIKLCIDGDRFQLLPHFRQRMSERGLVWPDVVAIIDSPLSVIAGGNDHYGREKWLISGTASDRLPVELVCVLDQDQQGGLTVFITIYFGPGA